MWRELVESVCSDCKFAAPASEQSLNEAEAAIGVALPPELRALLLESNGIEDIFGDGVFSAECILSRNLEMRDLVAEDNTYMSFDSLLCFGSVGDGDLFFFPVQGNGKVNNPDIFIWNHESDSRKLIAGNLEKFVKQWYSGQLDDTGDG